MFVVDGTPIDNETGNSLDAVPGRGVVAFGNAAMDINPSDIASVTVLTVATASALYVRGAADEYRVHGYV